MRRAVRGVAPTVLGRVACAPRQPTAAAAPRESRLRHRGRYRLPLGAPPFAGARRADSESLGRPADRSTTSRYAGRVGAVTADATAAAAAEATAEASSATCVDFTTGANIAA